jgi:hypothetical protein
LSRIKKTDPEMLALNLIRSLLGEGWDSSVVYENYARSNCFHVEMKFHMDSKGLNAKYVKNRLLDIFSNMPLIKENFKLIKNEGEQSPPSIKT